MTQTELLALLYRARRIAVAARPHGSISYTQWSREQHEAVSVVDCIDKLLAERPDPCDFCKGQETLLREAREFILRFGKAEEDHNLRDRIDAALTKS